ncbi:glycerophosphodiester phosphodiesterase [Enterococcus sp. LJL98]
MTYITAHSGSDGTPENNSAFLSFFKDKGIDVLEVDVRKNRHGQLVLHHDPLETEGSYCLLETFFSELAKSPLKINCDLKEKKLEEAVFQLAQRYGKHSDVFLSGEVETRHLKKWPEQLLMNLENVRLPGKLKTVWSEEANVERLERLAEQGAKRINISEKHLTKTIYQRGQELGLAFSVWTVNDLKKIESYVQQKLFNVTTRRAWQYLQTKETNL